MLLLQSGSDDHAVSAAAALDFVQASRRHGGFLPLIATALVLMLEIVLVLAGLADPLFLFAAFVVWFPLRYLIKRGLRTLPEQQALDTAAAMRGPLRAVIAERTLLLGPADAPPEHWCAIPVSEDEARTIQSLALPSARVRR